MLSKFHRLAWSGDDEHICQEAFRIMKEGTADEMEQYIAKMFQGARQQRLEKRRVSHKTFVAQLCVSAEGGTKTLPQINETTPWRGVLHYVEPEGDVENNARIQFTFNEWHATGKLG